ncbi:MAG: hypothetical protein RL171_628 [Pseudomonadota bacterium]
MGVGFFELGHGHGAVDDGFDGAFGVPSGQFGHHGGVGFGLFFGEIAPEYAHDRCAFE